MRTCSPTYVIADDLTGAASIAGELTSFNLQPVLYRRELTSLEADEAVVLDTASRYLADAQAHQPTADAVRRMSQVSGSVIVKKIDSRLRGAVRSDLLAFLSAYDGPVLVAAACPAVGVRTESGRQRDGSDLDIDLMSLVEEVAGTPAHLVGLDVVAGGQAQLASAIEAAPTRIIVADVITQHDLNDVVQGARDAGVRSFVGTYGLGQAVARARTPAPIRARRSDPAAGDRVLVIVGSISENARAQVKALVAAGAHEVVVDPYAVLTGPAEAEVRRVSDEVAAATGSVVVLHTQASEGTSDPRKGAPRRGLPENEFARALAPALAAGIEATPTASVVISGGETAGSLASSQGWEAFDVLGEWGSGIVSCRTRDSDERSVIIKPGGFGDPSTLADLAQQLLRTGRADYATDGRKVF